MVSTSRILVAIVKMCYEAKDWDALNENIILLSKRRSQLKQVNSNFLYKQTNENAAVGKEQCYAMFIILPSVH